MSEESQRIDPAGYCTHAHVERILDVTNEYLNIWKCTLCRERFYSLDFSNHVAIEVMEPQANLRDQFAMAALQASPDWMKDRIETYSEMARRCYLMANAMMEARKQ
jgi:hypothetical protein